MYRSRVVHWLRRRGVHRSGETKCTAWTSSSACDRIRAAERVLEHRPFWSDRRIATTCGLSPGTVSRIRGETGGVAECGKRLGADGRERPSSATDSRQRIATVLQKNPAGSLREIALIADVSPETVRAVKRSLEAVAISPVRTSLDSTRRATSVRGPSDDERIPIRYEPGALKGCSHSESERDHALVVV